MSEDYIDYIKYDYEDVDIHRQIYRISSGLNVILQFFTVFVNLFHLTVLLHKELRSAPIYILMIGICLSDLISLILDFWSVSIERGWLWKIPMEFNSFCIKMDFMVFNPVATFFTTTSLMVRPVSVWLAVFLALIRTMVVMFPTSPWMQKLTKPRGVISMVLGCFVFWTMFYTWHFVFFRIGWYPDMLDKSCIFYKQHLKQKQYVLYMTRDHREFEFIRDNYEYLVRLIPAICYPILTVALLIQLRSIKKKRQSSSKNALSDRSDSTTKWILFMTISFMLSEGLAGIDQSMILQANKLDLSDDGTMEFVTTLGTIQYICNNLRTLNATSHCFVCFIMSSQYRDVVKKMFCFKKKRNGTNIKVSSSSIVSLQSIGGRTTQSRV